MKYNITTRIDNGQSKLVWLYKMAAGAIVVLCLAFMAYLLPMSFLQTGIKNNVVKLDENVYRVLNDNVALNLVMLALFICAAYFALALLKKTAAGKLRLILSCLTFIVGTVLIAFVRLYPQNDQYIVTQTAILCSRGDYAGLALSEISPGYPFLTYLRAYSFQLGFAMYEEAVFRAVFLLFPNMPETYVCMLLQEMSLLMLIAGYNAIVLTAKRLFGGRESAQSADSDGERTVKLVALLLFFALPPVLYTSWLYGIIPAASMSAVAIWQFVCYTQDGKIKNAVFFAFIMLFAVWLKQNSMIVFIAVTIIWLLCLIKKPDAVSLLCLVCSAALVLGAKALPIKLFEMRSGETIGAGMPLLSWVTMGLGNGILGDPGAWGSGLSVKEFADMNYNADEFSAQCVDYIKERLSEFASDPQMTREFFGKKLLLIWNNPGFDSLDAAGVYDNGHYAGVSKLILLLRADLGKGVLAYMNFFQQFVLLGFTLGLISLLKKREPLTCIYPLTIFGGTLYHLLSEAQGQYTLQYFIFMLPIAARGYSRLALPVIDRMLKRAQSRSESPI